jgi:hypothetical protein
MCLIPLQFIVLLGKNGTTVDLIGQSMTPRHNFVISFCCVFARFSDQMLSGFPKNTIIPRKIVRLSVVLAQTNDPTRRTGGHLLKIVYVAVLTGTASMVINAMNCPQPLKSRSNGAIRRRLENGKHKLLRLRRGVLVTPCRAKFTIVQA